MKRLAGVLVMVLVLYVFLMTSFDNTFSAGNHETLSRRLGFYGVVTLGVGILIVAGGIDLSIGSLVGLGAISFGLLIGSRHSPLLGAPAVAALVVVATAALIGLAHGVLVTGPKLKPLQVAIIELLGLLLPLTVIGFLARTDQGFSLLPATVLAAAPMLALGGAIVGLDRLGLVDRLVLWRGAVILALAGLGVLVFVMLWHRGVPPLTAAGMVAGVFALAGVIHVVLSTGPILQPFLVTLCGLFIYRGLARWIAQGSVNMPTDDPAVENLRWLCVGNPLGINNQMVILLLLAGLLALLLHGSVHGRYIYALGHNEQAARYAGISTDLYKILSYVLCSTLAGIGGILYLLENRTAGPQSAGSLLELYAITGAVLGGCSLRGGEGTVPGMLLGAAVLPLLQQICNFSSYIGSDLEYTVIGGALLLGTITNELIARRSPVRA